MTVEEIEKLGNRIEKVLGTVLLMAGTICLMGLDNETLRIAHVLVLGLFGLTFIWLGTYFLGSRKNVQ
jgi:hypothetical protein